MNAKGPARGRGSRSWKASQAEVVALLRLARGSAKESDEPVWSDLDHEMKTSKTLIFSRSSRGCRGPNAAPWGTVQIAAAVFLGLSGGLLAQSGSSSSSGFSPGATSQQQPGRAGSTRGALPDGLVMQGGKVFFYKNGQPQPVERQTKLSEGITVEPDGRLTLKDGTRTQLQEGQMATLDGQITTVPSGMGTGGTGAGSSGSGAGASGSGASGTSGSGIDPRGAGAGATGTSGPGTGGARTVGSTVTGIARIVSGGQTGADRAALDWAIEHGIPHTGWCPQGRRAEDGSMYASGSCSGSIFCFCSGSEGNTTSTSGHTTFVMTQRRFWMPK